MTEKEALKEVIELLKLVMGAIIGSISVISAYNFQTGGTFLDKTNNFNNYLWYCFDGTWCNIYKTY